MSLQEKKKFPSESSIHFWNSIVNQSQEDKYPALTHVLLTCFIPSYSMTAGYCHIELVTWKL